MSTLGFQVSARLGALGLIAERDLARVVRELDAEFDKIAIPDFETAVRMVAMHMHGQARFYLEIAVDPQTKEVASSFERTELDQHRN